MIKKIKVTRVYQQTLELSKIKKIICHEGGSRSSKTWSIFQFFLGKAINGEKITVTIVRDKLTWIKSTLLKDFEEITSLMDLKVTPEVNPNRPEQVYNVNGCEFAFFGLDYAEKLHGRGQDWFWINEVMEVSKKHFDQLEIRTRVGAILDYNPYDDLHWVFDLHKREDVGVIKSTMLDNPFLPDSIVSKIKSYEPTQKNIEMGTADSYMWEVYGLGNKARLQGVVFNNWGVVDSIPKDSVFKGYGLDFGYTNDPSCLVAMYMYNGEVYFDELLYERGLTNQDISERMKAMNIRSLDYIYADSSEPKSIEEISRAGFNIHPVEKGADSINFGIDLMKKQGFYITKRSINADVELRRYKWKEDRSGRVLNQPVDNFNHFIDSARYVSLMVLKSKPVVQVMSRKGWGF